MFYCLIFIIFYGREYYATLYTTTSAALTRGGIKCRVFTDKSTAFSTQKGGFRAKPLAKYRLLFCLR